VLITHRRRPVAAMNPGTILSYSDSAAYTGGQVAIIVLQVL